MGYELSLGGEPDFDQKKTDSKEYAVTTKRDMNGVEGAEMCFLRSVKGYTRLDKIRSEIIRKELEISGIQDLNSKYKQNWINHLERMDNTRLPKHRTQLQT